ncbi:hypothetical protein ACJX0J_019566 [Zea mays]
MAVATDKKIIFHVDHVDSLLLAQNFKRQKIVLALEIGKSSRKNLENSQNIQIENVWEFSSLLQANIKGQILIYFLGFTIKRMLGISIQNMSMIYDYSSLELMIIQHITISLCFVGSLFFIAKLYPFY